MKLAIHGKLTMAQTSFAEFTHMISIGDAGCDLTEYRPQTIDPSAQLCMHFRDRSSRKRNDAPTEKDIWPLFEWLDSHQEIDGLLVQCGAGMSRSPAIALLALCHLQTNKSVFENMCHVSLNSAAKYIWPNPLVIELGDKIMARNGEIVSGVDRWRRTIEPGFNG